MRKILFLPIWAGALCLIFLTTTACSIKFSTDGTTDFLSSTTGKTWWTEDGLVKQGEHARVFVFENYDNLLSNIAQGDGEYLISFGQLLDIPFEHQEVFANRLQLHYTDLSRINARQDDTFVTKFIDEVVLVAANHSSPDL